MMVFDLNSAHCAFAWCLNMSVTQGKALVRMRKWVGRWELNPFRAIVKLFLTKPVVRPFGAKNALHPPYEASRTLIFEVRLVT